ncbi:MAG: RNA polymerase sigma factor [Candidatus Sumerlaeaceae bacterium]|nr:RNA polymerase sigma factor [Candidatus Sumerlaeaceae bacterium]
MDLRFASLPSQHADPTARVAAAVGRMLFGPGASPLTLIHPVETPTDGELMSELAQGHGEVLETLMGRHGGAIFSYLRRLTRSHETAEDLYQETWIRVVRNCTQHVGTHGLRPWLYRIAMNTARDHSRRERAEKRGGSSVHVELDEQVVATVAAPAPAGLAPSEADALHRAVAQLPEAFREVVELRYFEELPVAEIAAVMGLPDGTVKSRLARGLRQLEEILGEAS